MWAPMHPHHRSSPADLDEFIESSHVARPAMTPETREAAEDLARQWKFPTEIDLVLGRAKVTKLGKHTQILLPYKQT